VVQPFLLPKLLVQWDGWPTSQLATSVAAIILKEKLGFDVSLTEGTTSKQQYATLEAGGVHLAFEAWPASNPVEFQEFVTDSKETQTAARVLNFPYTTLFGRAGIFESCSRDGTDGLSICKDSPEAGKLGKRQLSVGR
jgi:hypothetical protein